MKIKINFVLLALSVMLAILSFFLLYLSLTPLYVISVDANATFSAQQGGFDVSTDKLTFGVIKSGGSSTRSISVTNLYDFPVLMKISSKGSIEPYISYESIVYLDASENKKVYFSVFSPYNAQEGYYAGKITFKFYPAR